MSELATYRYRLQEQRRRALEEARARQVAGRNLTACRAMLEKLMADGFQQYIPTELAQANDRLAELARKIDTRPLDAPALSTEIRGMLAGLRPLGSSVKRQIEEQAKLRAQQMMEARQRASSELETFFDEQMKRFVDPVVRDFALDHIQELRASVSKRKIDPDKLPEVKRELLQTIESITSRAEQQAREWKARKSRELKSEAEQQVVEMVREQLTEDMNENPEAIGKLLAELDQARERFAQKGQAGVGAIEQHAKKIMEKGEEAVMDELCRKETVKAILQSLSSVDMIIVGKPRLVREGNRDEVVVVARKPAGSAAEFKISLNGDLVYRFEGYEGSACKKDIKNVQRRMEEIYGIKLSDKRVLWENPDRLSAQANRIPCDTRRTNHD
ncbi:MAG: hypothetical protein FJY85_11575 [Deltaproteobacteria bacterium]|nr:hypothetical protein [Deltaproteobacteria bacterium]